MQAVDTNVLVYAHRREVDVHERAANLLKSLAEGPLPWAIPWPCIYEFHSVVTNRRIWRDAASTPEQAWRQISAWCSSPSLRLLSEQAGHVDTLKTLATRPRVRGGVVHDARIASICLAHGVGELLSRDRDFALFPELTVRDPFA